MKKTYLFYICFTAFFALLFNSYSYAGIIVSPARTELVVDAQSSYTGSYTVENDNEAVIEVAVTAEDWNNSPENANVSVKDWLSFSKKTLILKPHEKTEVKYTVSAKNYKGSLSAMLSFTFAAVNVQGINLMTSVPIYMTIAGTEKIDYEITNVSIEHSRVLQQKDAAVIYTVKNMGNVPLRLKGKISVKKGKKIIYEQEIAEQSPVYAGLDRTFGDTIKKLPKGKYVLNVSLNGYDKTVEKNIQIRVNKYGDISF
ncbi:MAG: hypothetical protein LBQ47_06045 [Endomicrobium sp.]|jgi:hypothetical protein|nr:hypothetical protein [Endomicrobium sp.]